MASATEARSGALKALWVGAGLVVLTTLSWWISKYHLGQWGLVLALAIAAAKAGLVAYFFMHLSERRGGPRLVFATSIIFVGILVGLILLEAGARPASVLPPGPFSPQAIPSEEAGRGAAPTREPPSTLSP